MKPKPLALLMTYARPDEENRLKTQLRALLELDFEVHTLGLGYDLLPGVTKHFALPEKSGLAGLIQKALLHLLFRPESRFNHLRVPKSVSALLTEHKYALVIAHDLELLPLLTLTRCGSESISGSVRQVDLHELHEFVAPAHGWLGLFWNLLGFRLRPYHDWLLRQLSSSEVRLVTVVNQSIGNWYVERGLIRDYVEIRNCAPYLQIDFSSRAEVGIRYLYHGKYARNRGLERIVVASMAMRPEDDLSFMLTGDAQEIQEFKSHALKRNPNLKFIPPVPMREVSQAISQFDVEIIYFEPVTKNLLFTLPNKFFEAIQGRLAILSGPSPELVRHMGEIENGLFSAGFDLESLEESLSKLDRQAVEIMRYNSHKSAKTQSSEAESRKLQATWENLIKA